MMFGYANSETDDLMPMALAYSHLLVKRLAEIRKEHKDLMPYLRPDAKSQITVEYADDGSINRIHTVVISTQHDEFISPKDDSPQARIEADNAMHVFFDYFQHGILRRQGLKRIMPCWK